MVERPGWVRDMGFSREEFVRVLPKALAGYLIEARGPDLWDIRDEDQSLRLSLRIGPAAVRRIGALELPVLTVSIERLDGPEARWREFIERFERGFHKGGG